MLAPMGLDPGVDLELDFIELETGRFDGEIEIEALERLELDAEAPIVPGSELREPVVGDHERAALGLAEMLERDCRDFAEAQSPGGEDAAMARQNGARAVDQNRDVEPEGRNAVGDAGDLAGAMNARVFWIGRQTLDR